MAEFKVRNLSVLAYAQGHTAWHYNAASLSLAQVLTSGFFDEVSDRMAKGDTVSVSAADGGAILFIEEAGEDREPVRFRRMAVVNGAVL